jgi:hypothetical protein
MLRQGVALAGLNPVGSIFDQVGLELSADLGFVLVSVPTIPA